jgi:hypothetical protein
MKTFHQILTEKTFYGFHNTGPSAVTNIERVGWDINAPVRRKKLFGKGIYFSAESNDRWGSESIPVKIKPKRPLLDPEGDIIYEDNPLGKQVEAIGKKMFKDFHMTNIKQLPDAIEKLLTKKRVDMLLTQEHGKTIYVVRDPKIIHPIQ